MRIHRRESACVPASTNNINVPSRPRALTKVKVKAKVNRLAVSSVA